MSNLSSFFLRSETLDDEAIVRSIVKLRILILSLTLVSIALPFVRVEALSHWILGGTLFLVGLAWSATALLSEVLLNNRHAAVREILIDVAWVFTLVYLFGRSTNPFIYYYLVITAYSAILLDKRHAWLLCGLCVLLYSGLLYSDVQLHFEHFSSDFKKHLVGMWLNFVGSAVVITFFISSLIQALKNQQKKLQNVREQNLKNEQLISLATVSASTVHNLATPLSTLSVLIDDLGDDSALRREHSEDLTIMREQINRCQKTMKDLSFFANQRNEKILTSMGELFLNFEEHYTLHYPDRVPKLVCSVADEATIKVTHLFKYAVFNLLNNAIESSTLQAELLAKKNGSHIEFRVTNLVKGIPDDIRKRWGQPSQSNKEYGLGIGSFLANSTIEQQGGIVALEIIQCDKQPGHSKVEVIINIPMSTEDKQPKPSP